MQDVRLEKIRNIVHYTVFDPALAREYKGSIPESEFISNVITLNGIVAWRESDKARFMVYVPGINLWHTGPPSQFSGFANRWELRNKDGVVVWVSDGRTHFATYDPIVSQWKFGASDRFSSTISVVQDGIASWVDDTGTGYAVYDPKRGWKQSHTDWKVNSATVTIKDSTLTIRSGDTLRRGYAQSKGAWVDGPTVTSAHFAASAQIGASPTNIWFTDMSIGATNFLWSFGDGFHSSARSPYHLYTQPGVYTVELKATGPSGESISSLTLRLDLKHQSIKFTPPSEAVVSSTPIKLEASSSSGLPVSFILVSGPAILNANQLTLTNRGSVVVRAVQAGSDTFSHSDLDRTIIATGVPQSLKWVEPMTNNLLRLNQPYRLSVTTSSGLPVRFKVVSGPAILTNDTILGIGIGRVGVVAEQIGDSTYYDVSQYREFYVRKDISASVASIAPIGETESVHVLDNYAYLADEVGGLQVIDVNNPSKPVRVWGKDHPIGATNPTDDVGGLDVVGSYAYLGRKNEDSAPFDWALDVIDVSDPTNPVRVGMYQQSGGFPFFVKVIGRVAYLAIRSGFEVIDITDPTKPVRASTYWTNGQCYGLDVVGKYAYLATADGVQAGLEIVDLNDPLDPRRVGFYNQACFRVQVVGDYAYLAGFEGGLVIIDVSNPSNPMLVGRYDTDGSTIAVRVEGRYAYVGDTEYDPDEVGGLQVVDVSNPANPMLVGRYESIAMAADMEVIEGHIYVATDFGGLQIVRIEDLTTKAILYSTLASASEITISWPARDPSYVLQGSNRLGATNWQAVAGFPMQAGDMYTLTIPLKPESQYFRLFKP